MATISDRKWTAKQITRPNACRAISSVPGYLKLSNGSLDISPCIIKHVSATNSSPLSLNTRRLFLLLNLIVIPTIMWGRCTTTYPSTLHQSVRFDIILYFVQPSSRRYSSFPSPLYFNFLYRDVWIAAIACSRTSLDTKNSGNVFYITMQIAFLTCTFRNAERNLHYDVVHISTVWVGGAI